MWRILGRGAIKPILGRVKDERKEQLVEFHKNTWWFDQEEKKWNEVINPSRRKIFIPEDIDIDDDDGDAFPGEDDGEVLKKIHVSAWKHQQSSRSWN